MPDRFLQRPNEVFTFGLVDALFETAVAHVGKVLGPLEVRHRHAARVHEDVRQHQHAALVQLGLGPRGRRSVRRLGDDLATQFLGVVQVNLVFQRRRDQDVAFDFEAVARPFQSLRAGEAEDRSGLLAVALERGDVDAFGVVNRPVPLAHGDDPGVVLVVKDARGVVTDVSETLDGNGFALERTRQSVTPGFLRIPEQLAQRVDDAPARRFRPPANPALRDRFARDASHVVEVAGMERVVGVGDPRHLPLAGAVVRRGHVDPRPDEVLADQLGGQPPRDLLQLLGGVRARLHLHAALRAAERHVDDRALVGHQRGQGHDLVLVDHAAVADAALERLAVVAVLGAPGLEHLVLLAELHRELHVVDVAAGLDLIEQSGGELDVPGRRVELRGDDVVEIEVFGGFAAPRACFLRHGHTSPESGGRGRPVSCRGEF